MKMQRKYHFRKSAYWWTGILGLFGILKVVDFFVDGNFGEGEAWVKGGVGFLMLIGAIYGGFWEYFLEITEDEMIRSRLLNRRIPLKEIESVNFKFEEGVYIFKTPTKRLKVNAAHFRDDELRYFQEFYGALRDEVSEKQKTL